MNVPAQCGTTAGRGKDGVEGGKGEVGIAGVVVVMAMEEAMVEGVPKREGQPISGDVGSTAGTVGVVPGGRAEAVGVGGGKRVVEEKLHARAEEAT